MKNVPYSIKGAPGMLLTGEGEFPGDLRRAAGAIEAHIQGFERHGSTVNQTPEPSQP